jgi:adenylate kinase family enzyme
MVDLEQMKNGIFICGLNGAGKTTLARELAKISGYKHIDKEYCNE